MNLINGITAEPKQKSVIRLPDGSLLILVMEYKPQQKGWFISELTYGDFSLFNLRIVTSPNILRQFKNQIPFGLACFVQQNQEPTLLQDFVLDDHQRARAKLFILSEAEVDDYEDYLSSG